MGTKELQKLKDRFILPVKEYKIKERIKNCLEHGVKILRIDDEIDVIFEKKLTPKKKEYWKEYALSTYKLINSPLA